MENKSKENKLFVIQEFEDCFFLFDNERSYKLELDLFEKNILISISNNLPNIRYEIKNTITDFQKENSIFSQYENLPKIYMFIKEKIFQEEIFIKENNNNLVFQISNKENIIELNSKKINKINSHIDIKDLKRLINKLTVDESSNLNSDDINETVITLLNIEDKIQYNDLLSIINNLLRKIKDNKLQRNKENKEDKENNENKENNKSQLNDMTSDLKIDLTKSLIFSYDTRALVGYCLDEQLSASLINSDCNVKIESKIASLSDFNKIKGILDYDYELNLLYRSSKDGESASTFHEKCDKKGPTITLILFEDGTKIGGFTDSDYISKENFNQEGISFTFYLELNEEKYKEFSFKEICSLKDLKAVEVEVFSIKRK